MEPVINTEIDINSHAHPLSFRSTPHEQRVRALVARVSMAVYLHGLPFGRSVTVADVLTPNVRRAPFNEDVNPNQIDVLECWKGLSHIQATELAMWYQFLHKCLHDEVQKSLREDVIKDLLESEELIDKVYLIAHILDCLCGKAQHIVDVSFVDLIDKMMGMFHDQFPNEAALASSNWSYFSGGLSLFLHNFLRLQDCFRHSAHGPCLEVKFDFQYTNSILTATGDVMWQCPNVRFLHVPTTRATGELYRITPFIWKEVDSPVRSPGCDDYFDQVDYTIPRSSLNFSWDPAKRCFRTIVGFFRDGKSHTVETVVMATMTTLFPDGVKFERKSRWSIKLDVTPNYQPSTPTAANRRAFDSRETTLRHLPEAHTQGSEHNVFRKTPENMSGPASSQKRKVSRPDAIDADPITKRRRHKSVSDVDDEFANDRKLSSDDWELRFTNKTEQIDEREANDARVGHACSQATHCSAGQCHIPSLNKSTWTEHLDQSGGDLSSFSLSPAVSKDSTSSVNALTADHDVLQQQEILRNYNEFAERKLYKDAGLISPVSDGERRAYESIFMGDSDEWSPVTDGSVVNLDTVMGEE